jgi:hypothetical protein
MTVKPDFWDRRAAYRRRVYPKGCPKHPRRPSQQFLIQEPGRKPKRRYLCVECAYILTAWHGATLEGVK